MIDTAVVYYNVRPTSTQLAHWKNKPTLDREEEVFWERDRKNVFLDNGAEIKCTSFPPNPTYFSLNTQGTSSGQPKKPKFVEPMLKIEFSLPKALWGNNVQILQEDDIQKAIDIVNAFFKKQSWMPPIDIGQGRLRRIDFVFNHCAGALVDDYRRAFFNITAAGRKPHSYPHGVQVKSESKHPQLVTTFYDKLSEYLHATAKDKLAECLLAIASGVFRQETLIRKPDYIEEKIGIPNPTLRDITRDIATTILQSELSNFHLDKPVIYPRDLALDKLKSAWGPTIGRNLYGYLNDRQTKTRGQFISEGTSLRSIQEYERKIIAAGVSLAMTDGNVTLPALTIDWETQKIFASL